MSYRTATATSCPNIALIKYWGDVNPELHIPENGSISMNLAGLITRTAVRFDPSLAQDQFRLDGNEMRGERLARVSKFLGLVRSMAGIQTFAAVESTNSFPSGVGIASSASAFAALSLAATKAAGLELDEKELSRLARKGSGSACRSIPTGFVEWQAGSNDEDSYAFSIAPPEYWDLVDCIVVVSQDEKRTSSSEGHRFAATSPLQAARVADAPRRLNICRQAILERDFDKLADIVELDSNLMHAVMITSTPALLYWLPDTMRIMQAVQSWRRTELPVCYTIDAGPNVHVLCPDENSEDVEKRLQLLPGVDQVLKAHPGGPAQLFTDQTTLSS